MRFFCLHHMGFYVSYTSLHSFNKLSYPPKSQPLRPIRDPKDRMSPKFHFLHLLFRFVPFTQFSPSHRLKNRSVHPLSRTPISRDISFAHRPQYPCSTYNLHHHHVFQSSPRLPTITTSSNHHHVFQPSTCLPTSAMSLSATLHTILRIRRYRNQ